MPVVTNGRRFNPLLRAKEVPRQVKEDRRGEADRILSLSRGFTKRICNQRLYRIFRFDHL
jgi:hypothetical protein